ncbi:MAG: hypothetical protein IH840_02805 [Candidatus Heimdallarchaeota archaeon]|nr:hypothetical protein [Candidatus Heimdallarchaeota archaeon]
MGLLISFFILLIFLSSTVEAGHYDETPSSKIYLEVVVKDAGWEFMPPTIDILSGVETIITYNNTDVILHDFTLDNYEEIYHFGVLPGKTGEAVIIFDILEGEYEFYCAVEGHRAAGMYGKANVTNHELSTVANLFAFNMYKYLFSAIFIMTIAKRMKITDFNTSR